MDLIVWPRHLPAVLEMLRKVPNLRCVIDHLAKPDVKSRQLDPWRQQIAEIARNQNVFCKLSGILTMAEKSPRVRAQSQRRDSQRAVLARLALSRSYAARSRGGAV